MFPVAEVDVASGRVGDRADRDMLLGEPRCVWLQWGKVDIDLDAEILPDTPYGVAEIVERHVRVGAAVGHDNITTMSAHEFVKGEVFKMPAVG